MTANASRTERFFLNRNVNSLRGYKGFRRSSCGFLGFAGERQALEIGKAVARLSKHLSVMELK